MLRATPSPLNCTTNLLVSFASWMFVHPVLSWLQGVQDSSSYPVCSMEIGKDESVAALKKRILQQHSLTGEGKLL